MLGAIPGEVLVCLIADEPHPRRLALLLQPAHTRWSVCAYLRCVKSVRGMMLMSVFNERVNE